MDEAQPGQEEEEDGSVSGRDRSRGREASSGAVGYGNSRGPDDRSMDATPSHF